MMKKTIIGIAIAGAVVIPFAMKPSEKTETINGIHLNGSFTASEFAGLKTRAIERLRSGEQIGYDEGMSILELANHVCRDTGFTLIGTVDPYAPESLVSFISGQCEIGG